MQRTELRARIGGELERLSQELTAHLAAEVGADPERTGGAADGKLAEVLQRRIRFLGQLVAGLACVDPSTIWSDRAGYGSTVRVREASTGTEETYVLMIGDFIDLEMGQVSLASPIGSALQGHRAGDRVTVVTPRGERRYEILEVHTLPARLGLAPEAPEAQAAPTLQVA